MNFIIKKKINISINIYKKSYNWEIIDIEFINTHFKLLNVLNKINVFDMEKRKELKLNYLSVINNYIEIKNKNFIS